MINEGQLTNHFMGSAETAPPPRELRRWLVNEYNSTSPNIPNMKAELKTKLIDDLRKSGFASEMEAIRLASEDGWDIISNYSYTDIQENKPRTVDFVGWKNCCYPPQYFFHNGLEFFLIVEVKKSEKPWIVFVESGIHEQNDNDPIVSGSNLPDQTLSLQS